MASKSAQKSSLGPSIFRGLFAMVVLVTAHGAQAQILRGNSAAFVKSLSPVAGPSISVEFGDAPKDNSYLDMVLKMTPQKEDMLCMNISGIGNVQVVREKLGSQMFDADRMTCLTKANGSEISVRYTLQRMNIVPKGMTNNNDWVKKGFLTLSLMVNDRVYYYEITSALLDAKETP